VIWTSEAGLLKLAPDWSLTGALLLWSDGSPAHVHQAPFEAVGTGWEALTRISRSGATGDRWLTLRMRLESDVRSQWEQHGTHPRPRALQALRTYVQLREWYTDDLGVLYLK
jgi:hypothetical protein